MKAAQDEESGCVCFFSYRAGGALETLERKYLLVSRTGVSVVAGYGRWDKKHKKEKPQARRHGNLMLLPRRIDLGTTRADIRVPLPPRITAAIVVICIRLQDLG